MRLVGRAALVPDLGSAGYALRFAHTSATLHGAFSTLTDAFCACIVPAPTSAVVLVTGALLDTRACTVLVGMPIGMLLYIMMLCMAMLMQMIHGMTELALASVLTMAQVFVMVSLHARCPLLLE